MSRIYPKENKIQSIVTECVNRFLTEASISEYEKEYSRHYNIVHGQGSLFGDGPDETTIEASKKWLATHESPQEKKEKMRSAKQRSKEKKEKEAKQRAHHNAVVNSPSLFGDESAEEKQKSAEWLKANPVKKPRAKKSKPTGLDETVRRVLRETIDKKEYERQLCRELFGTETFNEFYKNTGFMVGAADVAKMQEFRRRMAEFEEKQKRGWNQPQ